MKRQTTWILIADASLAHVMASTGKEGDLAKVEDFKLDGTTLPGRDLAADRPGRSFDRAGEGRHGMEPRTNPREVEQERFAREIVGALDKADHRQRFDRLILVAPPTFMGLLRGILPPSLANKVSGELTKDLTKVAIHDLPDHLEIVLNP
ncbi:MAG: host attachment protein [Alphaproteobacteria bacterium]|nr:host attachment protein [Alphaproteobacteria bacterium]